MQFSRVNHPYGDYSRYPIGNEDGQPYFHEYTNAASLTRPHLTQSSHGVLKDSNATGSLRMWYHGFTSLPPDPIHDAPAETHIHVDPAPAYLASHHLRTNPYQGPVQLVLDNFLAKLRGHNHTFGSTTQIDLDTYDPPGFEGRPPPLGLEAYGKGPPYIRTFRPQGATRFNHAISEEYNHTSENHDFGDSLPITKLALGAWKCLVCDKKLRRKHVAVVHFWNKHGGLRFNCEGRCGTNYCAKSFASRDGLVVHLYPVTMECSDCGHPMLRKNLRRHKQRYCHSGDRAMGKECTKGLNV